MKRGNGNVNRVLRIGMPVCMAILITALSAGYLLPRLGGRVGLYVIEGLRERSAGLVGEIWRWNYPKGRPVAWATEGKEEVRLPWMLEVILDQIPAYRYQKQNRTLPKTRDEDPAYEEYLENSEFFKEYEYLLREYSGVDDGGENTGEERAAANQEAPGDALLSQAGAVEQVQISDGGKTAVSLLPARTTLPVVGKEYVKEQLADYDFLMKHFYSVHSSTTAGRELMKAEDFLNRDFSLTGGSDKPQILIYHTHSQEEFADYAAGNQEATIVGVGDYLTELLQAKGYHVIHDASVYDLHNGKLDRNKAYTYALDGVTRILQENPSIEVVLDIHRDGVKEGTHLVHEINGKATAPIMFFNGLSQTPTGPIEYLKNPYREDNLAFSFQMQLYAEAYFPNFTRKIYLKGLRYNMHLRPRSALVEVGAQTNTYEEARNAMEPLAELLDMVLQTK